MALQELESVLGLHFKDQGLLQQALVHRSFLNEQGGSSLDSYERMEFLGDAVLELVISTELYQQLPGVTEGELTQSRSALVCRPTLAQAARRLSLGQYLLLGRGETESGGHQRDSILEETFESVVAAVYLDQGYEAARSFILHTLAPELTDYCRRGKRRENPKSLLQETVQGWGLPTPHYQVVAIDGPAHQPEFTVAVLVGDRTLAYGAGGKKADAEREAAQFALDRRQDLFPGYAGGGEAGAPSGDGKIGSKVHREKSAISNKERRRNSCSHSSNATKKRTGNSPRKGSSAAGNAGSGAFSAFSAPLTWMKGFGRNWRKS